MSDETFTKRFVKALTWQWVVLVLLGQITGAIFILSLFGIGLQGGSALFCVLAHWVLVATLVTATFSKRPS